MIFFIIDFQTIMAKRVQKQKNKLEWPYLHFLDVITSKNSALMKQWMIETRNPMHIALSVNRSVEFVFEYTNHVHTTILMKLHRVLKYYSEVYSERCRVCKMEHFVKIVNDWKPYDYLRKTLHPRSLTRVRMHLCY